MALARYPLKIIFESNMKLMLCDVKAAAAAPATTVKVAADVRADEQESKRMDGVGSR